MASFPTAGATLMPLAIATFRAAHPDVELSLAEGEPEEIAPRLRAGELDLALLFEFPGRRSAARGSHSPSRSARGPHARGAARRPPARRKPEVRLEDLRAEAWVQTSASSPCARHVVRCCHAAGFEPSVSFESDDYQTVQGLVAAGVGVALIPELALSSVRDDIVVRALAPESPVRRVFAATARSGRVLPAVAAMVDVCASPAATKRPRPSRAVKRPAGAGRSAVDLARGAAALAAGRAGGTPDGKLSDGTSDG